MTIAGVHREVGRRLAEHRVRYTAGRRAVVACLERSDGPRSAAELAGAVTIPVSSLYRTLGVLEEAGVVTPHLAVKGVARYELAEWIRGHHHHLVCIACGAVDDVVVGDEDERTVERVVAMIGSRAAFTPSGHALEIEGRCARCA